MVTTGSQSLTGGVESSNKEGPSSVARSASFFGGGRLAGNSKHNYGDFWPWW